MPLGILSVLGTAQAPTTVADGGAFPVSMYEGRMVVAVLVPLMVAVGNSQKYCYTEKIDKQADFKEDILLHQHARNLSQH